MKDRNQEILKLFSGLNKDERIEKIISLGKNLDFFPDEYKKDELIVKGCQAKLWMHAKQDETGNIIFSGDTEALISKGLLALMILFYSNRSSKEILVANPKFIDGLDLQRSLTHSRVNGIYSLQKQIIYYAKAFSILNS